MGSTDSRSNTYRIDQHYRLVRRFISDFYNAQITVVEHKQTKQQYALKQSVLQFNPQQVQDQMEARKLLSNRNFISLCHFWLQNDLGICSNLFKLHALFQYHENTLEDVINDSGGNPWGDSQLTDFILQMINGLSFLERNNMVYLLAGAKSIAIFQQESNIRPSGDQVLTERRALRQISQQQRCSLVELNTKSTVNQLAKQRLTDCRNLRKKRIYKLFEPLQGLTGTRSLHNLQSFMQVPLHPLLINSHEQIVSQPLIKLQNLFTVIILAVSLAQGCEIYELDIMKGGRLSVQKLKARIEELRDSHLRSSCELLKLLSVRQNKQRQYRTGQPGVKLKQFSFMLKKQQSRAQSQQKILKIIDNKVNRVMSRKRISLLQI